VNLRSDDFESAVTEKTKAIMPVHLFGQMADMDAIIGVADYGYGLCILICTVTGNEGYVKTLQNAAFLGVFLNDLHHLFAVGIAKTIPLPTSVVLVKRQATHHRATESCQQVENSSPCKYSPEPRAPSVTENIGAPSIETSSNGP